MKRRIIVFALAAFAVVSCNDRNNNESEDGNSTSNTNDHHSTGVNSGYDNTDATGSNFDTTNQDGAGTGIGVSGSNDMTGQQGSQGTPSTGKTGTLDAGTNAITSDSTGKGHLRK